MITSINFQTKEKILLGLFVYVFFFGLIQLLGIPNFIEKFTIDFFIILIFLSKAPTRFPGSKILAAFTALFFISSLANSSNLYHSLTFYRVFLYPYLIFIFVYNSDNNPVKQKKLIKFIFYLFIFQILGGIYKFLFIGITEKRLIGFISVDGGAYSTMMPLFAICFIIAIYLFEKRRNIYLFLILGFLFIGFVGAKRGIWIYFPVLVLIAWYFYMGFQKKFKRSGKKTGATILLGLLIVIAFIFGVRSNKTLNPEGKVGGSFNIKYVQNYAMDYTFSESYYGQSQGRGANFLIVLQDFKKSSTFNFLFGYGPDTLKGSSTYGEGIWGELGINGPVTGLTGKLVQLGVLANLLLFFVMYRIGKIFYRNIKFESENYWKAISFGGFLATILFFIDYLTYTSSFFSTIFALSFPYFLSFGIVYKRYKHFKLSHA